MNFSFPDYDDRNNQSEIDLSKPKYCVKKCKGINCNSKVEYRIKDIINGHINSIKIKEELFKHGHPKTLKMPNKLPRTLNEAITELIKHYKFFHKK